MALYELNAVFKACMTQKRFWVSLWKLAFESKLFLDRSTFKS